MSTSGGLARTRRRHHLMHAVLTDIATTGRPVLSPALSAEVDAEFGGQGEPGTGPDGLDGLGGLLGEVARRWYRTFDARLDQVLEDPPKDLRAALRRLWRELDAELAASRMLLDANAGHPALADIDAHHRRRLVAATGLDHDDLATPAAGSDRRSGRSGQPDSRCVLRRWRRDLALRGSTA